MTHRYAGPRSRLRHPPRFPADPRLPPDALGAYAARHLERKVPAREASPRWLASVNRVLTGHQVSIASERHSPLLYCSATRRQPCRRATLVDRGARAGTDQLERLYPA